LRERQLLIARAGDQGRHASRCPLLDIQLAADGSAQVTDHHAPRYPVSVKGVLIANGKVPLLLNERAEWELPGGKLEPGENPESCLVREFEEELNVSVSVVRPVHNWVYAVNGVDVLIVTYLVSAESGLQHIAVSPEHKEARIFDLKDVNGLNMPNGYKLSISHAEELAGGQPQHPQGPSSASSSGGS
jgi:mutator protein MutT